jgi:hypothetical protein
MHRRDDDIVGSCVEMTNPIATPTPRLTSLRPGTNIETRFHSLVNTPFFELDDEHSARVASKNSCLWRIIFVRFPLNDGDIETLDEDIIIIIICYYLINNDK